MSNDVWKVKSRWSAANSRQIVTRIVIEGDLELLTPAHFGSGDADDLTDMPLLVDLRDNKTPVLPGASLAGALRNYLASRQMGYRSKSSKKQIWDSVARQLFGGIGETGQGEEKEQLIEQSALIVDDALAKQGECGIERRQGVKLDKTTRTAEEKKLFDVPLWQTGSIFPLRFELVIRSTDDADLLKQGLVAALTGLANGEITLGKRKRRGYGKVQVNGWRAKMYELSNFAELFDWLENGHKPLTGNFVDLDRMLNVQQWNMDNRRSFYLVATFSLDGSLMIRSGEGRDDLGPDMVHLHGRQPNGKNEPVLSGTSLAGALRARAAKIVKTLGGDSQVVNELFGPDLNEQQNGKKTTPKASKLTVRERVVENGITDLVQNRVSIDRFTGGARDTALFDEQPVWAKPETVVTVDLHLVNPKDHEIGLLLLLLKDLWTGDLALGGESSIGRGRLRGKCAELICHTASPQKWIIRADDQADPQNSKLKFEGLGSPDTLQTYVDALNSYLNPT